MRLITVFLLVMLVTACGESEQRETAMEYVVIKAIDVDNDTWGAPDVTTLLITQHGHMDTANKRLGVVGDTLKVQVLYIDGEFKGMVGDMNSVINLSNRFNGR